MESSAVSNTGPILHLNEINLKEALDIFSSVSIPREVAEELRKNKVESSNKLKIINLKPESKNIVRILTNQRDLDLGESCAIALALQEKTNYFLTDDLDARSVAIEYNLEVHGTVGIILRAFRDKIINKKIAIEKVYELYEKSSLFITRDLIEEVIRAIDEFSEKR